jgi:dTDP-4-dehydrorhamnose 3,5-epimerase
MKIIPTNLKGCFVLEPHLIQDQRGYFMESFNEHTLAQAFGHSVHFVQDNQSFSTKGVLRGLHYQTGDFAQAKLVRVIQGKVLDVAVDIRPDSKTFGQHFSLVLSDKNHKQLYIPRGFAHGFLVLSDTATFFYKCDNFYNKASEGGIIYNDDTLGIDWNLDVEKIIISDRDQELPTLRKAKKVW